MELVQYTGFGASTFFSGASAIAAAAFSTAFCASFASCALASTPNIAINAAAINK